MSLDKKSYDCVVVGAGVGGLVCGCYLAKAGFKTLILEKNALPGGYASSFTKNGFFFDSCVHSIGGCGRGGAVQQVLEDLSLSERISFKRYNPSDRIVTPEFTIDISNDFDITIKKLCLVFKKEKDKILSFYNFLRFANNLKILSLRKISFAQFLNSFFCNLKLESIFSILVLGNLGLPASLLSATVAVNFYRQFIIDGGYYPDRGIQSFSDSLAERFVEMGGSIFFGGKVKKILCFSGVAKGVVTHENDIFDSKFVISDCDATSTFTELLENNSLSDDFRSKLFSMKTSMSMCVLYAAVKKDVLQDLPIGTNIWKLSHYDTEKMYKYFMDCDFKKAGCFLLRCLNSSGSVMGLMNASYVSDIFWSRKKSKFKKIFLEIIDQLIPNFSKNLLFEDVATPATLKRYTGNYNGAAYGWAATPDQFIVPGFSIRSPIKNLFLTSHWSTVARGISGVAFLGKAVAEYIQKRTQV